MSESDLEIKTVLLKKKSKKPPKSPTAQMLKNEEAKKLSTKEMVNAALIELKSRKGTSLYAIKKYLHEKFLIDVDKKNYIIKKTLKDSVESGSIVQIKGIGASGSFKLANKEKPAKKKKPENKKISKEMAGNPTKKVEKEKKVITVEMGKNKSVDKKDKAKNTEEKTKKGKPTKIAKGIQTPSKKSAMMKRKSIGSIIKKPKMKPTSKA